jgi:pimeloyl-ACP methyl ester carboxylesterase
MRAMKMLLQALLTLPIALGLAVLAALWWGQERLLFHPEPLPADHRFDFGADVHERFVEVPGARLSALHLQLPAPKGLVFYLHGNAGNLDGWFVNADFYRRAGFDLFMLDYRGYGKSGGRIQSQAQLEADVRAAWALVAPRYAGKRIVLFGRSLGTGLAVGLAAQVQPDLTVLVSPYTSLRALAAEHFPWVPAALLRYPMASDERVPRIRTPLLLLHGERDTLIAPHHSERLAALAPQARVVRVPDAGHNDVHQYPAYLEPLRAALDAL